MSGYDKNSSIWTTDLNEQLDGSYRMSRSPVSGRLRLRRANADRDLKSVLIFGILFIAFLVIMIGRLSTPPEITPSTKARTAIPSDIERPIYFIDDKTSLIDDKALAETAMKEFFDKTGVAPYLYITQGSSKDNTDMNEFAKNAYKELFDDEQHLLIVMLDNGGKDQSFYFCSGTKAAAFMDSEALQIIEDCLKHYIFIAREDVRYADDTIEGGKAVADAFKDAGDRLMKVNNDYKRYIMIGGAVLLGFLFLVFIIKRTRPRTGKLTIEKEYLPGEYIPASVMRRSDTDNAARGIKYRYGSEGVYGDIPNGVFLTHDMLHPKAEKSYAEMPSVNVPKGVFYDGGMNGGFNYSTNNSTKDMPSAEMPSLEVPGAERTFAGTSSSTLQYRDNKGNTVYGSGNEDNSENSFNKWAAYYNLNNSESAFKDDDDGYFGSSTSSYVDNRGITHLIKNKNDNDEEF